MTIPCVFSKTAERLLKEIKEDAGLKIFLKHIKNSVYYICRQSLVYIILHLEGGKKINLQHYINISENILKTRKKKVDTDELVLGFVCFVHAFYNSPFTL